MSPLRRILAVSGADFRLTLRDRGSYFWIFIAPILWVYFTGLMSRPPASSGESRGTPLTVIDEDASTESTLFMERLRGEGFDVKVPVEGETIAIDERTLRIPKGFAAALARGDKVSLKLATNDSGISVDHLNVQVKAQKAILRFLVDETLGDDTPGEDAVRLRAYWMHRRAVPVGYQQAVPGNLVLFLLMMTTASGAEIIARERRSGVLRRLAASSLTRTELVAGKFLGRAAVGMIEIGIFVLVGALVFRISWGASPLGLAAVLGSLLACAASLSLFAGATFRSPNAASGVSVVIVLIMAGLGGCWWPSEITPEWLQRLSLIFPTSWAMEGLHRIMSWGGGLEDVIVPSGALLAFGIFALTVAVRRLRIDI